MDVDTPNQKLYEAVMRHIGDAEAYVEPHGGGVRVLGVKKPVVYIQLTGACERCAMSLMTTKRVIERGFKEKIAPDVCVVNVEPGYENVLPDDIYQGGCHDV